MESHPIAQSDTRQVYLATLDFA